jgi:hypothetical protein
MAKKTATDLLGTYQQVLSSKLAEKKSIKANAEDEIAGLERELIDVKAQIKEAVSNGDNEGFKALTDQRSFCELRIQYLREQLDKLPEKIASESEGNDFARSVIVAAKEIEAERKEKASELVSELQILINDSFDMRTLVDGMISSWNNNIGDIGIGKAADSHYYISDLANLKGQVESIPAYRNILYNSNSGI